MISYIIDVLIIAGLWFSVITTCFFFLDSTGIPKKMRKIVCLLVILLNVSFAAGTYSRNLKNSNLAPILPVISGGIMMYLIFEIRQIVLECSKKDEIIEDFRRNERHLILANNLRIRQRQSYNLIKDEVREITTIIEEYKEKLSDGDYLKLMNKSKIIYERV